MRSWRLVVALAVVALVGCTQSPADRDLDALEKRVAAAAERSGQAGRAAGLGGVDSTSDSDAARVELESVEKELITLQSGDIPVSARERAQRLEARIKEVREKMGIR